MTSPRIHSALGLLALLLVALCSWSALPAEAAEAAGAARTEGRVFVLGFDGADYRTAQEFVDAGRMPNLSRLAREGTVAPLGTTWSPESPVAWAALNTGQNPSKTGVPGFVKRVLKDENDEEVLEGGNPLPAVGHQTVVERPIADMETGPLLSFLSAWGALPLTGVTGLVIFLLFAFVLKVILRLKALLAVILSFILGVVGAGGAWVAKSYVPDTVPGVIGNPVAVDAFWDVAARAGVESVVLDAAMSWDRPTTDGARVVGGLGLPDCRGDNGQWFIYTTDEYEIDREPLGRVSSTAGTIFRIEDWRNGKIESNIYGPSNFYELAKAKEELASIEEQLDPERNIGWKAGNELRERKKELERLDNEGAHVTVPMVLEKQPSGVRITIGAQSQDVAEGEWSDWYKLSFRLNPLIGAHAVTRVKILQLEDPFTLYVNTLDIDPAEPQFWQPVSSPPGYSAELSGLVGGPFETFGWACATMPFKDKVIDAVTMLEDIEFTMKWREDITREALAQDDWQLMMSVFSTPDRVQHMCYQFYDPGHPLYDEELASQKLTFFGQEIELRDTIPVIYDQVDRIIGWVSESLEPEDTLIICADHGFNSFREQVNVNNWLAENGYLKVREGLPSTRMGEVLLFVDWSETRAYALGMGMIYLNLEGRESGGIVAPSEARALMEEMRGKLLTLKDEREGMGDDPVVETVTFIDDVHDGPYRHLEGDLMVGFKPPYRVSWGTTSGGMRLVKNEDGVVVPGPVFQPNTNNWSGGHVSVSPEFVAGVFACNRKVRLPDEGAHLLHIAPTVLSLLGIETLPESDKGALEVE